jgi:hypothetical protein
MTPLRVRLCSPEMAELGEFETYHATWSPGDEFITGDGRWFRIVAIVADESSGYTALWKVERGDLPPER